jgi:hypothetical protein
MCWEQDMSGLIFALCFATARSIAALPVMAGTLKHVHLYRSDLALVVITAALCNDLAG